MQLIYVLLWKSYSICYNLRDKNFMQQSKWIDIKAIMFFHSPSQYEHVYSIWLIEIDAKRNNSWMTRHTYTRNVQWNKTAHAHNQDEQMAKLFT